MQESKEIKALFHLIDDPDEEVFTTISDRIISYGRGIIPNLEYLWENTIQATIQERIEMLIHRLHYRDLTEDFQRWKGSSYQDLLTATLLVSKFQYPDLGTSSVLQEMEKLRRNVWLECRGGRNVRSRSDDVGKLFLRNAHEVLLTKPGGRAILAPGCVHFSRLGTRAVVMWNERSFHAREVPRSGRAVRFRPAARSCRF